MEISQMCWTHYGMSLTVVALNVQLKVILKSEYQVCIESAEQNANISSTKLRLVITLCVLACAIVYHTHCVLNHKSQQNMCYILSSY